MLTFTGVDVGYHKREPILLDINFNLLKSRCYLIQGINGAGKSSLIRTMLGLSRPLSGSITRNYQSAGYAPQKATCDFDYPVTLEQYIQLAFKPNNLLLNFKKNCDELKSQLMLELCLNKHKDLLISQVSEGQLQKAMIIRSLISNPDFLVLDEPFASLDKNSREIVISNLIHYKKNHNGCICIIDHILDHASNFYDQRITLECKKAIFH